MSTNQQSELLQKLVIAAQRQLPETKERQLAITNLVDEMLRSRRICRPLKGQSLSGVLLEIYQEAREYLLLVVDQDIDTWSRQELLRNRVTFLLHHAFKQELNDARIKQLALEAQQHPSDSQQRQYLLSELVNAIQLSEKLRYPPQGNLPRDVYKLIYDDAVNRTLLYVFQKIDYYDSNRGNGRFMNWVNFRLSMIFLDLVDQTFKVRLIEPEKLESINLEKETPSLSEVLTQCIRDDPDNLFKKEYVKDNPHASFQAIFLARRVESKSWKEISEELVIPATTLSSFYGRCIQKFAPIIKRYVQEYAVA